MQKLSFLLALFLAFFANTETFAQCREGGGVPFVERGCVHAPDLNSALSNHPSPLPPVNNFGEGAPYGYEWIDTSSSPPTKRLCKATKCTGGLFVSSEWTSIGTISPTTGWSPSPGV